MSEPPASDTQAPWPSPLRPAWSVTPHRRRNPALVAALIAAVLIAGASERSWAAVAEAGGGGDVDVDVRAGPAVEQLALAPMATMQATVCHQPRPTPRSRPPEPERRVSRRWTHGPTVAATVTEIEEAAAICRASGPEHPADQGPKPPMSRPSRRVGRGNPAGGAPPVPPLEAHPLPLGRGCCQYQRNSR